MSTPDPPGHNSPYEGTASPLNVAISAVNMLTELVAAGLTLAAGRPIQVTALGSVEVVTSAQIDALADRPSVQRRLAQHYLRVSEDPDEDPARVVARGSVDVDAHLLGLARRDPSTGQPTVYLDWERITDEAARTGRSVAATVLMVLLHEQVHITHGHLDRSTGGPDPDQVGSHDAEVQAQERTLEALRQLPGSFRAGAADVHGTGLAGSVASELLDVAIHALWDLSDRQSPPYRVFRSSTSGTDHARTHRHGQHLFAVRIASGDAADAFDNVVPVITFTADKGEIAAVPDDLLYLVDNRAQVRRLAAFYELTAEEKRAILAPDGGDWDADLLEAAVTVPGPEHVRGPYQVSKVTTQLDGRVTLTVRQTPLIKTLSQDLGDTPAVGPGGYLVEWSGPA